MANFLEGIDDVGKYQRPKMPISEDYDLMQEHCFSKVETDRSNWSLRAQVEIPGIALFKERVNPINRSVTFARMYMPNSRLASQELVLSLISQHLRTIGLNETQEQLHEETMLPISMPKQYLKSQLSLIIQRGLLHAETFWDLHQIDFENFKDAQKQLDAEISRILGGDSVIGSDEHPITDEILDPSRVIYDKGEIVSANVNQLILILTSRHKDNTDKLKSLFILCHRYFISDELLLNKFIDRFHQAFILNDKDIAENTLDLLCEWTKRPEEIDNQVLDQIKLLYERELVSYFAAFDLFEKTGDLVPHEGAPTVKFGKCHFWNPKFELTSLPEEELARQLTYWTCVRFYSIKRKELLFGDWNNPRRKHRSPNVVAITVQGNRISSWVETYILNQPTREKRIEAWTYFIRVMRCLWDMGNYCDAFAVSGGFHNALYGMKRYVAMLKASDRSFMNEVNGYFEDGSTNNQSIRNLHHQALSKGGPCLPYIGTLLMDVFKYDAASKVFSKKNGMVDVTICRRVVELIEIFDVFKKHRYALLPIQQVQQRFETLPNLDTDTLFEMAKMYEDQEAAAGASK